MKNRNGSYTKEERRDYMISWHKKKKICKTCHIYLKPDEFEIHDDICDICYTTIGEVKVSLRKCLRCDIQFDSTGSSNRICTRCSSIKSIAH